MIIDKLFSAAPVPSVQDYVERGILAGELAAPHISTPFFFHPSAIGYGCIRKNQIDFLYSLISSDILSKIEYKKLILLKTETRLHRIFDNGKAVHELFHKYLKKSGVKYEEEKEIYNYEYRYKGYIDGIIYMPEKFIVEFKTMNHFGFQKLQKPAEYHLDQIYAYQNSEHCPAIIVYINSNTQDIKEFYIAYDEQNTKSTCAKFLDLKTHIIQKRLKDVDTSSLCNLCVYDDLCSSNICYTDIFSYTDFLWDEGRPI